MSCLGGKKEVEDEEKGEDEEEKEGEGDIGALCRLEAPSSPASAYTPQRQKRSFPRDQRLRASGVCCYSNQRRRNNSYSARFPESVKNCASLAS
ncbi:hypothetical protein MHYP_G00007510 [Metynnis hypsauchen]